MKNTENASLIRAIVCQYKYREPKEKNSATGLSGYREQKDEDAHVKDDKYDHRPHEPGKFSLEGALLRHIIGIRGAFGSYQTNSNAQAHGRRQRSAIHFVEQRSMAV